jgi:hypothetical protein
MTDTKKLTKWLNNTQDVIDMYYIGEEFYSPDGSICPQEVINIKKLIIEELSKIYPMISDSLLNEINEQIRIGVFNANDLQRFFNLDLNG